jgi:hypothetical protein
MLQRHVRFNVNELARCAAEAVCAKACVDIAKYPDGMYNKSMLLTMDDGSRVVAKVPNPNAGLPHWTTASEVATMDFVSYIIRLCVFCIRLTDIGPEILLTSPSPKSWPGILMPMRILLVQNTSSWKRSRG